ncbi:hypothetical protein [Roseovarius amoyensis]|uniref:hypothetical protein n=1 Tax=Roseovarius amoyensis TaxID=2211448 RepID=UPI001EF8033F|nr:hypothetical protein [Roseovarius amoyensis]
MKRMFFIVLLGAALSVAGVADAQAACRVEYKAKSDNPLTLYYDTAVLSGPCSTARAQLRRMLAARGLVLLKILSARPQ